MKLPSEHAGEQKQRVSEAAFEKWWASDDDDYTACPDDKSFALLAWKTAWKAAIASQPASAEDVYREITKLKEDIQTAAEGWGWKYDYRGNSSHQAALNDILDWAFDRKPIIAASATPQQPNSKTDSATPETLRTREPQHEESGCDLEALRREVRARGEISNALHEIAMWCFDLTLTCITTDGISDDIRRRGRAAHAILLKYRHIYDLRSRAEVERGAWDLAIDSPNYEALAQPVSSPEAKPTGVSASEPNQPPSAAVLQAKEEA